MVQFSDWKIVNYIFYHNLIEIQWKLENYESDWKSLKFSASWDQAQLCSSISLEMPLIQSDHLPGEKKLRDLIWIDAVAKRMKLESSVRCQMKDFFS